MFVPGCYNGTRLHTALGYSSPANLINNCHDQIRKASLVQLICPVRRERVPLSFGAGKPNGAWHEEPGMRRLGRGCCLPGGFGRERPSGEGDIR